MIEKISILGTSVSIYYMCWFISVMASVIAGQLLRKEYGLSASKAIIYVSLISTIGVLLMALSAWICGGGRMDGMNYVRIVYLFWLYFPVLADLLKDPREQMMDYLTLTAMWFYVIAHIGCIFPGCCHGFPSEWGIYSNAVGYVCFPVQLVEVGVNLIICFVLLWMRKQDRFRGTLYPWYMFLFGSTRVITECFRDNTKLFLGLSELALHALISMILGAIALILIYRRKGKTTHNETN